MFCKFDFYKCEPSGAFHFNNRTFCHFEELMVLVQFPFFCVCVCRKETRGEKFLSNRSTCIYRAGYTHLAWYLQRPDFNSEMLLFHLANHQ